MNANAEVLEAMGQRMSRVERQLDSDLGDALSQLQTERDRLRGDLTKSQERNRQLVGQLNEARELVPARRRSKLAET